MDGWMDGWMGAGDSRVDPGWVRGSRGAEGVAEVEQMDIWGRGRTYIWRIWVTASWKIYFRICWHTCETKMSPVVHVHAQTISLYHEPLVSVDALYYIKILKTKNLVSVFVIRVFPICTNGSINCDIQYIQRLRLNAILVWKHILTPCGAQSNPVPP